MPTARGERLRLAPVPFIHQNRFVDWFGDDPRIHADIRGQGARDQPRRSRDGLARRLRPGAATCSLRRPPARRRRGPAAAPSAASTSREEYATGPERCPPSSYARSATSTSRSRSPARVTAVYAGSPLPLDFGEREEAKSVVLVELRARPAGPACRRLPLTGGRALRLCAARSREVEAAAAAVGEAIVKVVVESRGPDRRPRRPRRARAARGRDDRRDRRERREPHGSSPRTCADRRSASRRSTSCSTTTCASAAQVPCLRRRCRRCGARCRPRSHEDAEEVEVDGLRDVLTCELPVPA